MKRWYFFIILTFFLFVTNNNEIVNAHEMNNESEKIVYIAPDLDLASANRSETNQLTQLGWRFDKDIPYFVDNSTTNSEEINDSDKVYECFKDDQIVNVSSLLDDTVDKTESLNSEVSFRSASPGIYSPVPAHESKVYKVGDKVHCNRFNGPKTDNKHYSKDKARAYINFVGSDCSIAVAKGLCRPISDHCNKSTTYHRGWCSVQLGRSINYHRN